jgi:outer membrane biosynthesis protein TonB
MDAVTEVLLDRSHYADRLSRMVVLSLAAHAAVLAVVAVSPSFLSTPAQSDEPAIVISLAAGEGPIQGRTAVSNRAVQQVAPDPAKPAADTPPAAAKPEMVEAVRTAKPTPPKPDPKKPEPLRGRTPTQGAQVRTGSTRVETGQTMPIPFGGLATGGGTAARTEFANFCCPEYLEIIQRTVLTNTNAQQGQAGIVTMKFVIRRDGTIADIAVAEGQTPNQYLELAGRRGLEKTQKLPPLPSAYPGDRLTVLIDLRFR